MWAKTHIIAKNKRNGYRSYIISSRKSDDKEKNLIRKERAKKKIWKEDAREINKRNNVHCNHNFHNYIYKHRGYIRFYSFIYLLYKFALFTCEHDDVDIDV